MKTLLDYLFTHQTLSREAAKEAMLTLTSGTVNPTQIASFMTVFNMRAITLPELIGFREALISQCDRIDLSAYHPMDVCGTGGDGKNTFNISTLTAFVVAGAGVPVAKHGNYGVSSISGSSNVLEELGVTFPTDPKIIEEQLATTNLTFLHAPLFHPALKNVGAIRKELGLKTLFNKLGPLVNPAQPKVQMTGVFNLELARMYHYILQEEGVQYRILYGLSGCDEITLTDTVKVIHPKGESFITAENLHLEPVVLDALDGGKTVAEAAHIFTQILKGKGTPEQNRVVCSNAAMALLTYYPEYTFETAYQIANESLLNLKAANVLTQLKSIA